MTTIFADLSCRPPAWTERAACNGTPTPNRFVPPNNGKERLPPPECELCPVRAECLKMGTDEGLEGWWGGEYLRDRRGGMDPNRSDRYQQMYDAGLNDIEIGAAVQALPETVGRWRRRQGLPPQAKQTSAGWFNRHGEPCCRNGHPTATDSVKRDDGNLLCITCNFGNVSAA